MLISNFYGPRAARLAAATLLLAVAGCRMDMRDQPKLKPLAANAFFADGRASRLPPAHAIARGHLPEDNAFLTGKADGQFVAELPVPVTADLLHRGQERFGIYCTPCHGRAGTGEGIVVQRGYIQPRSYHDPAVRGQPVGYFFDVISRGFGNMPDYAAQVPVADRWAIVAYIRVLQLSQYATGDWLEAADRALLDAPPPAAADPHAAAAGELGHAAGGH